MNQLIITSPNLTMSSREIAELCDKDHKNVKRDIENMIDELEIDRLSFERIYQDSMNRQQTEFSLPKDLTLTLVAGYNIKLRKRIIDRWMQLEAQAAASAYKIPQTLPEALRLAADLADQVEGQKVLIDAMKPKANGYDLIAGADGSLCLRDAAKELQQRPKDLIGWLSANKWIYKRAGCANWIGYQDRIQSGLLEHKANIVISPDGSERIRDQVRITGKGLARLADEFAHELGDKAA